MNIVTTILSRQQMNELIVCGTQFLHADFEASLPRHFTSLMLVSSSSQLSDCLDEYRQHLLPSKARDSFILTLLDFKFLILNFLN